MNIELFDQIKTAIQAKPEAFDMRLFFGGAAASPCGTTACIAGWAITLAAAGSDRPADGAHWRDGTTRDSQTVAEELLGITHEQSENLFFHGEWDNEQGKAYEQARRIGPQHAANVACDYIDYFVGRYGSETKEVA